MRVGSCCDNSCHLNTGRSQCVALHRSVLWSLWLWINLKVTITCIYQKLKSYLLWSEEVLLWTCLWQPAAEAWLFICVEIKLLKLHMRSSHLWFQGLSLGRGHVMWWPGQELAKSGVDFSGMLSPLKAVSTDLQTLTWDRELIYR